MHVLFFTRFSIYDPTTKGFRCVKKNDYCEYLFSNKRLDEKFIIFENLTLPSIVQQTEKNWSWHIMTSHYLPLEYILRLENMTKAYSNIHIHFVQDIKDFQQLVQKIQQRYSDYASVRLDDDDGLSPEYVAILSRFQEEKLKFISFPNGQLVTLDNNNNIIYGAKLHYKRNAFGLAAINFNVFSYNHTKIHQFRDVIYPENEDMYYAFCSDVCDTQRKFRPIQKK
jgi:hypothetical protein